MTQNHARTCECPDCQISLAALTSALEREPNDQLLRQKLKNRVNGTTMPKATLHPSLLSRAAGAAPGLRVGNQPTPAQPTLPAPSGWAAAVAQKDPNVAGHGLTVAAAFDGRHYNRLAPPDGWALAAAAGKGE